MRRMKFTALIKVLIAISPDRGPTRRRFASSFVFRGNRQFGCFNHFRREPHMS